MQEMERKGRCQRKDFDAIDELLERLSKDRALIKEMEEESKEFRNLKLEDLMEQFTV